MLVEESKIFYCKAWSASSPLSEDTVAIHPTGSGVFLLHCLLHNMDAYFPSPLPDESLYSLVTRYRTALPHSSRHILQSFGYRDTSHLPDFLGQNAYNFYQRHPEFWSNERAFIRATTGYNLLSPFLSSSVQTRFYKALQGYTGCIKSLLRPQLYFPNHDFSSLRFCSECVVQDIEQYGVAYWHRSHCVWFASVCWKHSRPLIAVEERASCFQLPPQELKGFKSDGEDDEYSEPVTPESLVQELMVGKLPFRVNITHISKAYSTALCEKGVAKKADLIQNKITESYSPSRLRAMRIRSTFNGQGWRRWVRDVLAGQMPVHIPEHLLVIKELFGNISNLGRVLKKQA